MMKNKRQMFLLVALLLLFICGPGLVSVKAQTVNKSQGASTTEGGKPAPAPERSAASTNKQEKTRDERPPETQRRDETARQRIPETKNQDTRTDDSRGRAGTANQRTDSSFPENPPSSPNNTTADLNRRVDELTNKVTALEKASPSESSWVPDWMPAWLGWSLIALVSMLALVGIVIGYNHLRHNREIEQGKIAAGFNDLRKQQRAISEKVKQLEEVSKNLSLQIAQQKSELSNMQQVSRNASYAPAPSPMSSYQQPKEVAQFPVMVDDYLARVRGRATPVKYDYKEKLLVEDRDNEGNLLVVRDDMENALYLVPSFGFFQKKSDYTTYFENYYACARPTSGSVWIRQPATVNRVNGGWQLYQPGELEVR